jgi:hypothetical protein
MGLNRKDKGLKCKYRKAEGSCVKILGRTYKLNKDQGLDYNLAKLFAKRSGINQKHKGLIVKLQARTEFHLNSRTRIEFL